MTKILNRLLSLSITPHRHSATDAVTESDFKRMYALLFLQELFRRLVGRFVLSREIIFGLHHAVSTSHRFDPALASISSTLLVPIREVFVLAGLGNILLVVGFFLSQFSKADLLVLFLSQSIGNVGLVSNLAKLELKDKREPRASGVRH